MPCVAYCATGFFVETPMREATSRSFKFRTKNSSMDSR